MKKGRKNYRYIHNNPSIIVSPTYGNGSFWAKKIFIKLYNNMYLRKLGIAIAMYIYNNMSVEIIIHIIVIKASSLLDA